MSESDNPARVILDAGFAPAAPGRYFVRYVLPAHHQTIPVAAASMGVDATVLDDLVKDRRRIDADLAGRLSCYSGLTAGFWLNLQTAWDYTKSTIPPGGDLSGLIGIEERPPNAIAAPTGRPGPLQEA